MRHLNAVVYILVSLCCFVQLNHAQAQLPSFESGEDCMDWFLLAWADVEKNHAIAGVSEYSGTARKGLTSETWFSIRLVGKSNVPIYYLESEKIWGNDQGAGIWSKVLKRGGTAWCSSGDLGKTLSRFPDPQFDAKGKEIYVGTTHPFNPPDPFLFSVYSTAAYESSIDRKFVTAEFENAENEERGISKKSNFSTFYRKDTFGFLFECDQESGMPLRSTGYFKNPRHQARTGPEAFKDVSYIAETKWECVDDAKGVYVPVSITNLMNRINLKVNKTLLLELNCSYKVKELSDELLSDENMKLLLEDKGPVAALRKELYDSARKRRKIE
jgi:hypothetical protein